MGIVVAAWAALFLVLLPALGFALSDIQRLLSIHAYPLLFQSADKMYCMNNIFLVQD